MKKNVTYLQVKSMADKLMLAGERPTIGRVYDLLSTVATRNQVSDYLKRWRAENSHALNNKNSIHNIEVEQLVALRTAELKQSLSLVRATLESTADGIILMDNNGKIVEFNQRFVDITKIPKEVLEEGDETLGLQSILGLLEKPEETVQLIQHLRENPTVQGDMGEVTFRDGRIIERHSQPHREGNKIIGRVWSFRDVTKKHQYEEELRLRQRAIIASPHAVIIFENDENNSIIFVNPAFKEITGESEKEALGQGIDIIRGDGENVSEWRGLNLAIRELKEGSAVLHNRKTDGQWYWGRVSISPVYDANDEVKHFVAIMADITGQKALEKQLMYQATHDALTDLPNRLLLEDRIRQMILYASARTAIAAVLFLDLDRFKLINDSMGHVVGDSVIKTTAGRLKKLLSKTDTVARIGGDEFIIVLPEIENESYVEALCKKILKCVQEPIITSGNKLNITASVGISLYPQDGSDVYDLIRNADTAMYDAKDAGRNAFSKYHDQMSKHVSHLLTLENDLREALNRSEFELVYQPVVIPTTGEVAGVEALIRWNHPDNGVVNPVEFIFIAEQTGLINLIGKWVCEEACRQSVKWNKLGLPPIYMAINISAKQLLKKDDFLSTINNTLQKTGMNSNQLVLELTENILMSYNEQTADIFNQLKKLGISLAIDDFGTGYSSLSYLKRFPIDTIKIDRGFVHDVAEEEENRAIVIAIIAMASRLGLSVVGEGAENKAEVDFLLKHNCNEIQGFYFSKPLDAETATQFLLDSFNLKLRKPP